MTTPTYDTDAYAWTQAQAQALRDKDWAALDVVGTGFHEDAPVAIPDQDVGRPALLVTVLVDVPGRSGYR